MDADFMATWLRNMAQQLAIVPTAEMEAHVRASEESLSMHDSIGCLLDPTAYMRARDDGTAEDARNQLEIARHLLAARKAIDKREAFAETKRDTAATGRGRRT